MDVVVDDHLLLQLLLGNEPRGLRTPGSQVFITGLWYHRLCRAVAGGSVTGALSRKLGASDPVVAASAARSVVELPESVGLISLRELGWPMAQLLEGGARLNLLSLEAIAAARRLGAELCLAAVDRNQPLVRHASGSGVSVRVIEP